MSGYIGFQKKVKVGPKHEYVNTYEDNWLQKPEENLFDQLGQAVVDGVNVGSMDYIVEGTLWAEKQNEDNPYYNMPSDDKFNPMVPVNKLKEDFDLELEEPTTLYKAIVLSEMKKDQLGRAAKMARHMSWDTPVPAALTFLAAAGAGIMSPTAWLTGAAIGLAVPVVGPVIGGGVGVAANALMKWKTLARLAKQVRKTRGLVKAPGLAKAAAITARKISMPVKALAKKPGVRRYAKVSAIGGAGNALEEVAIWYINKSNGYKYDLAPAVTMGAFAPAIFMGMSLGVGRGIDIGYSVAKDKLTPFEELNFSLNSKEVLADPFLSDLDIDNFNVRSTWTNAKGETYKGTYDEGWKANKIHRVEDIKTTLEELNTKVDDPVIKKELAHVEAVDEFIKKFDNPDAAEEYLMKLMNSVDEVGVAPHLDELFPIFKNRTALRKRITELRKRGILPKKGKLDNNDINKILETDAGTMHNFIENNTKPQPVKPIKRDMDTEVKPPTPEKAMDEKMKELETSNKALDQLVGEGAKDLNKALKTFTNCLTGVVEDV